VAEGGKSILKAAFVKANRCASGWHPLFAWVIGLLHSQSGSAGRPD